ncbi:MAG: Re/Si-specific NAD(P)(+) transhydrogenase subunit alpha [Proteobacteria bacterium]|nr:Re/Si-specific NAD(P)(+) transhydrogenase subunit alpha [Pseudomonadota bacterium]
MKILVLKETTKGENRVALTPDLIAKYNKMGYEVLVEKSAGENCSITDKEYKDNGAKIITDAAKEIPNADIIVTVQAPQEKDLNKFSKAKKNAVLVGALNPYKNEKHTKSYKKFAINAFAAELFPRITRAQSMDILSSQSNLAGYRAVIDAVYELDSAMPMMMTAAGTISPAKVMIMGAGVAGLQAIATAKRLGAVVTAFDVRAAAKEQVESLGAKFIDVANDEDGETKAGYAKEMSEEYKKRQEKAILDNIVKQDIVITTALIPGKPAPKLISADMVKAMKQGAVIVDMAAIMGGNCALTKLDEVVEKHGVKIIGYGNVPSRIAADASKLYAKNLYNFVELITDKEKKEVSINLEDEIIKASLITAQEA